MCEQGIRTPAGDNVAATRKKDVTLFRYKGEKDEVRCPLASSVVGTCMLRVRSAGTML